MSAQNSTPSADSLKLRLRRFLIDSIAFMYEVDHIALKKALSGSSLVSPDDSKSLTTTTWSVLPPSDRAAILSLAETVSKHARKVSKQQISSIPTSDCTLINTNVLIPSKALLVHPCSSLRLLRVYTGHKGTDRYKAGHYHRKSRLPWIGWRMQGQAAIAQRLIADDYLAELVAPNEETKLLLGEAIAKFGDKYWTDRSGEKRKRSLYAAASDVALNKYVGEKVAALK